MEDLLTLDGRVALITGAGQGVGRQTALHFADHGGIVVVNDYFRDRADAVVEEIAARGGKAMALQCDVSDFDAVGAMVDAIVEQHGHLDILVNNAGNQGPHPDDAARAKPFWESVPDDWRAYLAVNLYGVLNCTRHALPHLMKTGNGSIVTVISEAGRWGDAGSEIYAGAKAGAAGVMRSVARGCARYGVRANSVAIGATRTPRTAAHFDNPDNKGKLFKLYPLRRAGEPTDVANAILFLSSDAASYVTGQVYAVNGGFVFTL